MTGACLCGAVRFAFDEVLWCAHCHCTLCRRAHAAGVVTWVGTRADGFRIVAGEPTEWRSSEAGRRRFCPTCGSQVTFEGDAWPDQVHVPRALLPDDVDIPIQGHAYWESRAPWMRVADDLPRS